MVDRQDLVSRFRFGELFGYLILFYIVSWPKLKFPLDQLAKTAQTDWLTRSVRLTELDTNRLAPISRLVSQLIQKLWVKMLAAFNKLTVITTDRLELLFPNVAYIQNESGIGVHF